MPWTVAAHCEVPPVVTVIGLQLTETDVIEADEGGEVGGVGPPVEAIKTVAVPARLGCCVLVAVTVTVPAEVGAVKTPVAEMEPADVDQATAEL